ncbi:uncharacterized protein LOC131009375 [Salvia miltiorrhiza]|uniref:uncharacterized protein LOC131009375 n=1 Tax=Salvia miltiorrhiza TaxID=226208 RepID=UPI0025AD7D7A|nr:uncharacterized protein LOC131009375 [Salvia miltiorrhiza]XP_057792661.1 uncharacterized protein LOC131009375 [Salvia miltiorrhiza]
MDDAKDAEFSLKVMINKKKTKVLFVEADSHFADILLSFLTLPLGRIIKVLEKHYGDEAPIIGSLSSLYHSLVDLDITCFWTEGAKQTLLNPASSFEDEYARLKLDYNDYHPAKYFTCRYLSSHSIRSVSMYHDSAPMCLRCEYMHQRIIKQDEKECQFASEDGVFTINTTPFIISDDLQIFPNKIGLLGIISILGLTDADKAQPINVTFGFSEIMSLLKASLISQTPFSDLILSKARHVNSVAVGSEPETSVNQIKNEDNTDSKKIVLKVMVQKSCGKLLYAQAEEDFVEFLFSLFNIPLGGAEHLLAGKTCIKAIDNLYRSTAVVIDDKYFKAPDTRNRLTKPNVVHGCISDDNILLLTEECLPDDYSEMLWSSSDKFPNGKGSYLKTPQTYHVTDDLTVTPLCIVSILSTLNKQEIPISDVKEVELQIGLKEGLNILKASLTSTTALTDALLDQISIKQPKQELLV